MTEQEAEAWMVRLMRIWKPKKVTFSDSSEEMGCAWCAAIVGNLRVEVDSGRDLIRVEMFHENDVVSLVFDSLDGLSPSIVLDCAKAGERNRQFANKWLPFFRRNCWLSGCPIEATAHEKAEWIRGFSQEELQAWNLKM